MFARFSFSDKLRKATGRRACSGARRRRRRFQSVAGKEWAMERGEWILSFGKTQIHLVFHSLIRIFAVENLYTMRKIVHYIILLTLVLSACTSPSHEAMRQRLKYVSDCNRADTVFTERWLSTVDSLVAYFDRHGSANDRMMAHYVQGRVYHDMGEAPQALECYQKAVEQADTTSSDCDLHTLTAIYGQLADLFDSQYLPDDEKQALQMAEQTAMKNNDTLAALKSYELRIRPYFIEGEKDSMLFIMKNVRKYYLQAGDTTDAATAIYAAISICLDKHDYPEAKRLLDIYEEGSGNFDKDGNLLTGEMYYYDKGRYLLAVGQTFEAKNYFEKILDSSLYEARFRGLLSVYERMGIADSISKYASLFAAANDSSFMHVNQQQVEQIRALYNYNRQKQIAEKTTAKLQKTRQERTVMAIVMLLLVLMAAVVIRKIRHRNERAYIRLAKEIEEKKRALAEAIDRLRLLNYDHEKKMKEKNLLQQSLDELHSEQIFLMQQYQEMVREKNQEIDSLESNVKVLESKLQQYASVDMEAAFKRTAIYKLFEKKRSPKYANDLPKEKDWEELTALFRTYFVSYYSFIMITHRLPVNQFRYCILLRLGFDGTDIGVLMNKDRDQRHNLRRLIYEELFGIPVQVRLLEEKLKPYF